MRKRSQNIRQTIETPALGFGVVLFALTCFILLLGVLIIVVRFVVG